MAWTSATPEPLHAGARLGIWCGFFGWIVGFVLATLPDTGAFAAEIAGGAALSAVCAWGFERIALRRPPPEVWVGAMLLALGLLLLYVRLVVEPAFQPHPQVGDRLRRLGSATSVPVWLAGGATVAGVAMLLCGWLRRPPGG